jgi:segregation and condensation protein B
MSHNLDKELYIKVAEALLFCAGRSVRPEELVKLCNGLTLQEAREIFEGLIKKYSDSGVRINKVAGGFRMETCEEVAPYLKKFFSKKGIKWTRSLMETLAIIAYFQPITRAEISAKRGGVDPSGSIKTLIERGFVKIVGRKNIPGRPLLYGTTEFFLEYFGLESLKDLPPLEELKRLSGK